MPARDWPTKAEHSRQDCIALSMDIQRLTEVSHAARQAGDDVTAAQALGRIRTKARKIQEILRSARSPVDPLPDDISNELEAILSQDDGA